MKLENKIKRYIKLVNESQNTVDKAYYLKKIKLFENELYKEYENKINCIYAVAGMFAPPSVYNNQLEEMKRDFEKKYNCNIDPFGNIKIILNKKEV